MRAAQPVTLTESLHALRTLPLCQPALPLQETMASCRVCLLAVLCSLVILTTFIGSTQSASCCMMYTSRPLRCQRLMGYTIQTIMNSCDINAVIFHLPGRFLCADPSSRSTQRGMKCVDERRQKPSWMNVKGNVTSA